jgi:hypothetical protein
MTAALHVFAPAAPQGSTAIDGASGQGGLSASLTNDADRNPETILWTRQLRMGRRLAAGYGSTLPKTGTGQNNLVYNLQLAGQNDLVNEPCITAFNQGLQLSNMVGATTVVSIDFYAENLTSSTVDFSITSCGGSACSGVFQEWEVAAISTSVVQILGTSAEQARRRPAPPAVNRRILSAADIALFDEALFASIKIVHEGELG